MRAKPGSKLPQAMPPRKIHSIAYGSMTHSSAIKLNRTDTTLDLSQKAEKGMKLMGQQARGSRVDTGRPTGAARGGDGQSPRQLHGSDESHAEALAGSLQSTPTCLF
eukprot:GHUV01001873.1.p1 GENE.GHUV01001873.1~~GHUV01001873.1.p1  ORF type:complete len:107 (-),score=6.44 GHUV01001873.1:23-343(-)